MQTTPKSMRLHIGLFGRTNVGKSSFLNMIAGQDVAITSPVPGTTTDVVEKTMELLPIGPVCFLDTAGVDDTSELSEARLRKTAAAYARADVFVVVIESMQWGEFEKQVVKEAELKKAPLIVVINKIDIHEIPESFTVQINEITPRVLCCSSAGTLNRDQYITEFKRLLIDAVPDDFLQPPSLVGDLLPSGGIAVLIVPIDLQAPKGRLILPQVQTIRDALDNDASVVIVKEREYAPMLDMLKRAPDLVVCDSQVVTKMTADTPQSIKCTTFSILFARLKGDLNRLVRGAAAIDKLKAGDKVLIAEACSHHAAEDDIGRVKIPRWLRQYSGIDFHIDTYAGRDYPENLSDYKLVIHCGACMLTRREMLYRMHLAEQQNVPVTNYGVAISVLQGVIKRVLQPFPAALDMYERN